MKGSRLDLRERERICFYLLMLLDRWKREFGAFLLVSEVRALTRPIGFDFYLKDSFPRS